MELWNRITGTVRVELTAADPERLLGAIAAQGIPLWDVERPSVLCAAFSLRRVDRGRVAAIAEKGGGKLRILQSDGIFYTLMAWRKRPILIGTVLLLLFASVYVPGRILFVRVEGNQTVPTRLIQETAARLGLGFGVSRRGVRSEQIKNELIGAIEELEWVGVNTGGCVATITVREGEPRPSENRDGICNLVASSDGVIDSISLMKGTLVCEEGQVVREGQLLVSGYADLGICTRAMEAEAEIYALTRREKQSVLPANTLQRGSETASAAKYSLIFGKKRINLYSDSGILPTTCGKMTEEIPLRLPGGWTLPVKLVVERYTQYKTSEADRTESEAAQALERAARNALLGESVAGEILTARTEMQLLADRYVLQGRYECREMIARQEAALDMEGDTKDDPENGERGAG